MNFITAVGFCFRNPGKVVCRIDDPTIRFTVNTELGIIVLPATRKPIIPSVVWLFQMEDSDTCNIPTQWRAE